MKTLENLEKMLTESLLAQRERDKVTLGKKEREEEIEMVMIKEKKEKAKEKEAKEKENEGAPFRAEQMEKKNDLYHRDINNAKDFRAESKDDMGIVEKNTAKEIRSKDDGKIEEKKDVKDERENEIDREKRSGGMKTKRREGKEGQVIDHVKDELEVVKDREGDRVKENKKGEVEGKGKEEVEKKGEEVRYLSSKDDTVEESGAVNEMAVDISGEEVVNY